MICANICAISHEMMILVSEAKIIPQILRKIGYTDGIMVNYGKLLMFMDHCLGLISGLQ